MVDTSCSCNMSNLTTGMILKSEGRIVEHGKSAGLTTSTTIQKKRGKVMEEPEKLLSGWRPG